ncbi:GPI inositol-deacylase, partial [Meloidogyne graminicola]
MVKLLLYFFIPILLLFFYIFVQFFLLNTDVNYCNMTYMWRRINYLPINVEHKKYSLFLYGEGLYADNFRKNNFLNGFPILFVPGNAGSGRQVRSIGSLLQNKTESRMTNFHFDVFAVDFNEELTAYNFDYIISQSNFLIKAINSIYQLYKQNPQKKLVIIGHSMGGIVIQKALMNKEFNKDIIAFIISFSVPYLEPPFYFDKRFFTFWNQMNKKQFLNLPKIVSINGGLKDEFIDEDWTKIHSSTAALDHVWLDIDHKCILWCNQLIRHTSRCENINLINNRYLSSSKYLFSFIQLNNCSINNSFIKINSKTKFWLFNQNIINQSPIKLNLINIIFNWPKIKLSKTKNNNINLYQIPIEFTFFNSDFFIYSVNIIKSKCKTVNKPSNIFFLANNKIRRIDIKQQNNLLISNILIYNLKEDKNNNYFKLLLIDTNQCKEYLFSFSFNLKFSLIRGFRRIRHILPITFILILTFCCLFSNSNYFLANLIILILSLILKQNINNYIEIIFLILFNLFLLIIFYIFFIYIIQIILLNYIKLLLINNNNNLKIKYFIFGFSFIFFFYLRNSTLILITLFLFENLMSLNYYSNKIIFFSISTLQFLFIFFQLPLIVDYIWKYINYNELKSSDIFNYNFNIN